MQLPWIAPGAPPEAFPPVEQALAEPDGLLAFGGDLSPERLLFAYRHGIFPWYSAGQPLLWWSPNPRAVLWPDEVHVSRSLRKRLRASTYEVRLNTAFEAVVRGCAAPRGDDEGTWITNEMYQAYTVLHRAGYAHSVEAWLDETLVGGLYGVALGGVFFGESMFAVRPDASKVALVHLARSGFDLIDCQLANPHLTSMGATSIPRTTFVRYLDRWCNEPGRAVAPLPARAG